MLRRSAWCVSVQVAVMKAMWKPRLMWRHWLVGMNCGDSRSFSKPGQ